MATIAHKIDLDGLALYKDVSSSVGTPGTTPATAAVLLDANEYMDDNATPRDGERCCAVNPAGNSALVDGLKGLFQSSGKLDAQYRKGMMGMDTLGFKEIYMDQNVNVHTTGETAGTTLVDGTISANGSVLHIDGLTTADADIKKGDVFTVAAVFSVNPQNRQSTGKLQQFTVTADVTAGTSEVDLAISPSMTTTTAFQTIDAFPQDGAVVTFLGTQTTGYPQNLAYHRDAFTLGSADLIMPNGVDFASRQVHEGISMRIVRDYDITNDKMPCRIDVLYGWKTLYSELACRVWG